MNYSTKGQVHTVAGPWQGPAVTAPEATLRQRLPYEIIGQLKWTSTIGNRMLLETGFSRTYHKNDYSYQPEIVLRDLLHRVQPVCAGYQLRQPGQPRHRARLRLGRAVFRHHVRGQGPQSNPGPSNVWQASLAHVSGAHAFKVGLQHRSGYRGSDREVNGDINQQFSNDRPLSVQVLNTPITQRSQVNHDLGVFIQDTWTMQRLTVSPGLRWDYFNASIPAQSAPAGRFVPERSFAAVENIPNWHTVVPRIGASYDLTGRGRTAVKGNFGLYVESAGTALPERYNPMLFSTDTRTWTDLNNDRIAQENELGPTSNRQLRPPANRRMDPDLKRPYQSVWNVGLNHELAPGLGVGVNFTQRQFHRTNFVQNLAIPRERVHAPHRSRSARQRPDAAGLQHRPRGVRTGRRTGHQLGSQHADLSGR